MEKFDLENPFEVDGEMRCSLKVTGDKVLVWQKKSPEKIGSIIIPDTAKEEFAPEIGQIVTIGPGYWDSKKFNPTSLKPGQFVLFDKSTPWRMTAISPKDGKPYELRMMGEKDIRALIVANEDPEGLEVKEIGAGLTKLTL